MTTAVVRMPAVAAAPGMSAAPLGAAFQGCCPLGGCCLAWLGLAWLLLCSRMAASQMPAAFQVPAAAGAAPLRPAAGPRSAAALPGLYTTTHPWLPAHLGSLHACPLSACGAAANVDVFLVCPPPACAAARLDAEGPASCPHAACAAVRMQQATAEEAA
eukprot:1144944-Pelagomonas_calceolata.AAC.1